LTPGEGITLSEIYPPHLPDLFHGSQLVVFGRFKGQGHAAVKLAGTIGKETKEFVYELNFPDKTGDDKAFVEDLWARRKVGFLLDQIRVQGESKEVVNEVILLAKRYGIATPYTSHLLVPDGPIATPITKKKGKGAVPVHALPPQALLPTGGAGGGPLMKLEDFARQNLNKPVAANRMYQETQRWEEQAKKGDAKDKKEAREQLDNLSALNKAQYAFQNGQLYNVQQGKLGVDFAVQNNALRCQDRLVNTASRYVQNRNCVEVGGAWIDDGFNSKMETVTIKAMSKAYFTILERHPLVRDVYQLGNYVIWVTPSGKALIIDRNAGQEEMPAADIDRLFTAAVQKNNK
jgi:Ca-activated chloride channel homolog